MVTTAKDNKNTLVFLAACVVLVRQNLVAQAREIGVQVISPTEFDITVPRDKLTNLEVKVYKNSELGDKSVDFHRTDAQDQVLRFSDKNLNLKKGDKIQYVGFFVRDNGPFGEGGIYTFDGNFHSTSRRKRETPEELTEDSETRHVIKPRFGRFKKHWWGKPHYAQRRQFGQHGHFHGRPLGPLLFNHRPALWGFGHVGKYGDHGPWDGHGGEEDFYDWQLNNNNRKDEDQPTDLEENKPDEIPTWNAEENVKEKVPDEKIPDVVKPVYETPDVTDVAPPVWNGTVSNGTNQGTGSDSSTGTAETQPIPTTTEQVPDIDIRFREFDEDE